MRFCRSSRRCAKTYLLGDAVGFGGISTALPRAFCALSCVLFLLTGNAVAENSKPVEPSTPLRILVMDPLAAPLSCVCVKGHGQRDYQQLARYLEKKLGRKVEVLFDESLALAMSRMKNGPDLIIGPDAMVRFDCRKGDVEIQPIARLTDKQGRTDLTGLFVVRTDDRAKTISDLKDRKLSLGPIENPEVHSAALLALEKLKLKGAVHVKTLSSIDAGVFSVADNEAAATIIPDYLPPLLEECGKVEPGSLRKIGTTEPVPFIVVFATEQLKQNERTTIQTALLQSKKEKELLVALESKKGFLLLEKTEWTDWRGPNRDGRSSFVPDSLAKKLPEIWTVPLTGPALAGIAATESYVVVPDKNKELTRDVFRCFDARTGKALWKLDYSAEGEMEYTNAPRATPVIDGRLVYLQGALGDLHCVDLKIGAIVWKKDFVSDFGAEVLNWGFSSPPLVVNDLLIINPGAKEASIVALNKRTGKIVWKTAGHAAAYSALMTGTFGGIQQIVGYDVAGLAGWDIKTGKRLWEVIPKGLVDFNVGTPVLLGDKILVATENNETRMYQFDGTGKLNSKPIAVNQDLAPDTCSPVVLNNRVFCSAYGQLYCLDLKKSLKTIWDIQSDDFYEHTNLIAGNNRILVWTSSAELLLVAADSDSYKLLRKITPFAGKHHESMSHPAIMKDRIYVRNGKQLKCLTLVEDSKK